MIYHSIELSKQDIKRKDKESKLIDLFIFSKFENIKLTESKRVIIYNTNNGNCILKYNEYKEGNEYAYAASLIAKNCGIMCPIHTLIPWEIAHLCIYNNISQTDWFKTITKKKYPNEIQLLQELPQFVEFNPIKYNSNKKVISKGIAKLLAFDMFICNDDRFNNIFEYLFTLNNENDNEYRYNLKKLNAGFVNNSNFSFINGQFYSIDHEIGPYWYTRNAYQDIDEYHWNIVFKWLCIEYLKFPDKYITVMKNEFIYWSRVFNSDIKILEISKMVYNSVSIPIPYDFFLH